MRVSREQATQNRERIVTTAARLFRERGFDGIGVDALMKAAGLTHGGFYGHFGSKDALVAEAVERGLADGAASQEGQESIAELADFYLSPAHRQGIGTGCVLAALGGEMVRQTPSVRGALTAYVRGQIARITTLFDRRQEASARREAIVALSALVGAMILARAVDDPALSDEILTATRETLASAEAPADPA